MDLEFYASLCTEAVLFGIYTVLFVAAMYLLFRRRHEIPAKSVHTFFIIATIVMYCVSIVHLGLAIRVFFNGYLNGFIWDPSMIGTDPICIVKLYLPAVNFVLSDAIVLWRAYLLWNFDKRILVVPGILVLGTLGVAIVGAQQAATHMLTIQLDATYSWDLAMNCLTLATNLVVTGLIAVRTRVYHRMSKHVPQNAQRKKNQAVLALLIESGSFYCCSWIVFFIIYWCRSHGNFIITDMIAQLTVRPFHPPHASFGLPDRRTTSPQGIYSTLIIILVALKMTSTDADGGHTPETSVRSSSSSTATSEFLAAHGRKTPQTPIVVGITSTLDCDRSSLSDSEKGLGGSSAGTTPSDDAWKFHAK
ncbi:hypothetical protein EVG20_g1031 [Dentipellis fragilis]|uniref:Uncharacterized protein n=1 Tax=Dentipellis fragilis TaxID=205917 RepID=A0A4Y9ZDT2_9AGAM|nr:hypothetical protein EVG20_g1031 [Dentipellis fragilis]